MTRAADPADPCYDYNVRNPDQTLGAVKLYAINVARRQTDGLDYSGRYQVRSLGAVPGSLTLDARLSRLFSFHDTGVVIGEEDGTLGFPKWSGSLTVDYHLKEVSVSWMARFLSAMKDQAVLRGSIPANNPLGYSGTPSYEVNNLTAAMAGGQRQTLRHVRRQQCVRQDTTLCLRLPRWP